VPQAEILLWFGGPETPKSDAPGPDIIEKHLTSDAVRSQAVSALPPELEECRRQFESIKAEATDLTAGLNEFRFNWKPSPSEWSIQECLGHLNIVGANQVSKIEEAIELARTRGWTGAGPFTYRLWEQWLVRITEPPVRRRFKSLRRFIPAPGHPVTAILPTFLHLQDQFMRCVAQANGLDLSRVKAALPLSNILKMSLGMVFRQTAAHERRHLSQARRVRENLNFPA
jgi:DinB superfamily